MTCPAGDGGRPLTADVPGEAAVDGPAVTAWFEAHVPGVTAPLRFDLLAGGRSNMTYRVTDAAGRTWVLRRPPLSGLLPSAHDMAREHRILAALASTSVPVPPVTGLCQDPDVNGAPFFVMDYVDGHVLRDEASVEASLPLAARARVAESLVDALVALHDVDPDAVGLGTLGRREGYVDRQLRRWRSQWDAVRTRDVPLVEEVHDRLAARVPRQGAARIVHGDYRLDNVIVGDTRGDGDWGVRAVLDWELCTLGDPLADVGLLVVYWSEPGDDFTPLGVAPTAQPGFPTRGELTARYAAGSGRDLIELDFFVALGFWKLAVIAEGVWSRYRSGAYGEGDEGFEVFGHVVEPLLGAAVAAVERSGR